MNVLLQQILRIITITILFLGIGGSTILILAQDPVENIKKLEKLDSTEVLSTANECTDGRVPVKFGQIVHDAKADVSLPHVDITKVDSYLSGDVLNIVFYLRDVPTQLTKNRVGSPENALEYEWSVEIDIDNDLTTGSSQGTEYALSATAWVFDPDNPITGTIESITQQNTWVYSATTTNWHYLESAGFSVDTQNNKMILSGNIPDITPTSRLIFETFDYNPGADPVRDKLNCTFSPKSVTIPITGGSLTSDDTNLTIIFPPNAITSSTTITYTKQDPSLTGNLGGIDFFELEATDSNGVPVINFEKPLTITYRYANTGSVKESSLFLYWLSGTTWITDGITLIGRDNNIMTATTTHFTTFAILGDIQDQQKIYLPVILK